MPSLDSDAASALEVHAMTRDVGNLGDIVDGARRLQ